MNVLSIVLPAFMIILLGVVLTRAHFLSGEFISDLNRLTYYVGLPAYLFVGLADATFGSGRAVTLFVVMLVATLLTLAIGFKVAKRRGIPAQSFGSFLQAMIRGNLAYIGLPVISLAIAAHGGAEAEALRQIALLSLAPLMVVTNTLGVLLLMVGQGKPDAGMWRTIIWQLFLNPLLLSSGLGIWFALKGFIMPFWVHQSFLTVGQIALPLSLLGIGGTLVVMPLNGKTANASIASLLKVAVGPLIGWPLAQLAGLSQNEIRIAVLFLATPTAAASFTLAGKLGGDEALAASSVVISTLFSVVSMSAVLALV